MAETPPANLSKVTPGHMHTDMNPALEKKRSSPSSGISSYALGVAKVIFANYEEMTVTLRTVLGEDQEFQRVPVPMTFPGAGRRYFLGAMPEAGDHCIVGWRPQDTAGGKETIGIRIPVILSWIVPGVWAGQDWMVTQPFTPDELGFTAKDKAMVRGAYERVRHKLRHMQPGNIVASSSQGADLVLDEGVLLANRRCNEIRLRDADQALVVRTLQQFHAMAGARIYGGMVQRDGLMLPTNMYSDGKKWAQAKQVQPSPETGKPAPVHEADLLASEYTKDLLTPGKVFRRSRDDDGNLSKPFGPPVDGNLDPFVFLKRGLFIDDTGLLWGEDQRSDAVYGGKAIYRVSVPGETTAGPNAILGAEEQTLTEYRIELAHTSDGRLPVTEQTDGFDAERLPRSDPKQVDPQGLSPNMPFLEMVYGSVVGNTPFSQDGRSKYGHPLTAQIYDDTGAVDPKVISALGQSLDNHSATLFKMTPPTEEGGPETFWTVLKDGRVRASLGGPTEKNSLEMALRGGMHLGVGGKVKLDFANGFQILTRKGDQKTSNLGLELGSEQGAVRIYAGGDATNKEPGQLKSNAGLNSPAPGSSLSLEGRNVVSIKGSQLIELSSSIYDARVSNYRINALSNVEIAGGDKVGVTAKTMDLNISGKVTENFSGPKDNLPTNGPQRETRITSLIPGLTVDKYSVPLGSREEVFDLGNHSTTVKVGNLTYETNVGTWKAKAGSNEIALNTTTGLNASIVLGNAIIEAKAGAASLSGQISATVKTSGQATVTGAAGVYLGGPGKTGLIISSSDLDPLTGLPLQTYGMGSPGHRIGSHIP